MQSVWTLDWGECELCVSLCWYLVRRITSGDMGTVDTSHTRHRIILVILLLLGVQKINCFFSDITNALIRKPSSMADRSRRCIAIGRKVMA